MTNSIKIAIADDHKLLRQGIISLLQTMEGIEMIGEMSTGEEAVNFAAQYNPDVFLIDIVMTGMSGIEATRWIKEQSPQVKIILISSEVRKDFILDGIRSGIDGYLNKNIDHKMLSHAINKVLAGERYFSPEIMALGFEDITHKNDNVLLSKTPIILSKDEEEILTLLVRGMSPKEISDELFVSVKTVETFKLHIKDRLNSPV